VVAAPKPRKKPKSVRGRRVRKQAAARVNHKARGRTALVVMLALLGVGLTKLVLIQTVDAAAYAAAGENQRGRTIDLPAQRGSITDRNGVQLAFSVEGKRIAVRPTLFADDQQRGQVADVILATLGNTASEQGLTRAGLIKKMSGSKKYVYVADKVMPAQADAIMEKVRPLLLYGFPKTVGEPGQKVTQQDRLHLSIDQKNAALNAVVPERQDIREYPNAAVASSIVGATGWNGRGLSGIENRYDATLAGTPGSRDVDVDNQGTPIPGTVRGETPATDGTSIQLTIDSDIEYRAQQVLQDYVTRMGAHGGNVMIMEVKTGKVVAGASFTPKADLAKPTDPQWTNGWIADPIEPGSVNKVVTFAAALQKKLITPTTVLTVDGRITTGGVTVSDAWSHGPVDMTATGILAKSSNVGTLMLANEVGVKDYYSMITKFGIGKKTGIQLSGESAGRLPALAQWTGSTFANVPIGQGVSMTMVQLAAMYQTIANGGVRMQPTLIQATTTDGRATQAPTAPGTRVIDARTAKTLSSMLTATMQDGDMAHRGTAPAAAIPGYQVAGKTGTAQQVVNGRYSDSMYTTTFAGFLPADNPKYVVVISLDRPSGDREGGTSAAPMFHDLGAYLMDASNVPPSTTAAPVRELYVNLGG
jgi:cell division protein FtsI (penicillin-binding protein 3)